MDTQKTLTLKMTERSFVDKATNKIVNYSAFVVTVAGVEIPLVTKDNTAKHLLMSYFKGDLR